MNSEASVTFREANSDDQKSLVSFINGAFRGDFSCQGWTTEQSLLDGQRLDGDMLNEIMNKPNMVILIFFEPKEETLIGCVSLQYQQSSNSVYLGLLTVRPDRQARGHGKFILRISEKFIIEKWNPDYIEITVIVQRNELINYYERRGFYDTKRREPFPMNDPKFGIPKRNDLAFCIMRKDLVDDHRS